MKRCSALGAAIVASLFVGMPNLARATAYAYFNDTPDGLMAMASGGARGAETADDFVTTTSVSLTGGTFTGLVTGGASPTGSISNVIVEIYRVFPFDSVVPGSGNVPTRVNSPSDVEFTSADSALSQLSFSTATLNPTFAASNSVQAGGIHPAPNQTTGGDGPIVGTEVRFTFSFLSPLVLDANHYFFVPVVEFSDGASFYWLSASRPISGGGTPFSPDLQTWTRDNALAPDWLRVGSDIVGGAPPPTFNASFSLAGQAGDSAVPEPAAWAMMLLGFGVIAGSMRRSSRRQRVAYG